MLFRPRRDPDRPGLHRRPRHGAVVAADVLNTTPSESLRYTYAVVPPDACARAASRRRRNARGPLSRSRSRTRPCRSRAATASDPARRRRREPSPIRPPPHESKHHVHHSSLNCPAMKKVLIAACSPPRPYTLKTRRALRRPEAIDANPIRGSAPSRSSPSIPRPTSSASGSSRAHLGPAPLCRTRNPVSAPWPRRPRRTGSTVPRRSRCSSRGCRRPRSSSASPTKIPGATRGRWR